MNRRGTAKRLATKHPLFTIHAPQVTFLPDGVSIQHRFSVSGGVEYSTVTRLYGSSTGKEDVVSRLAVYDSLVEALSYWKATSSPIIHIEPKVPLATVEWYKTLIRYGMMEYRYTNGLPADSMPGIEYEHDTTVMHYENNTVENLPLLLISGGKDSTVTLSVLSEHMRVNAFVLNKLPAADRVMDAFKAVKLIRGERGIDPALLEMNKKGYLNGHTPFSALLSIVSVIAGVLNNASVVIASNEASSEVPFATHEGFDVNHQYSKSFHYEIAFSKMMDATIPGAPRWFSFLRPLSEPHVTLLLAQRRHLLKLISSCNKNQLLGSWCGSCPKCVSTWILLSPYVDEDELLEIFAKNALEEGKNLLPSLLGRESCRPLECVGTPEELEASLRAVNGDKSALQEILKNFGAHAIPEKYSQILNSALGDVTYAR